MAFKCAKTVAELVFPCGGEGIALHLRPKNTCDQQSVSCSWWSITQNKHKQQLFFQPNISQNSKCFANNPSPSAFHPLPPLPPPPPIDWFGRFLRPHLSLGEEDASLPALGQGELHRFRIRDTAGRQTAHVAHVAHGSSGASAHQSGNCGRKKKKENC